MTRRHRSNRIHAGSPADPTTKMAPNRPCLIKARKESPNENGIRHAARLTSNNVAPVATYDLLLFNSVVFGRCSRATLVEFKLQLTVSKICTGRRRSVVRYVVAASASMINADHQESCWRIKPAFASMCR